MVRITKSDIIEFEASTECVFCKKKFNTQTRQELEKLLYLHYKYVHKTQTRPHK
jgi:hypothetical protein